MSFNQCNDLLVNLHGLICLDGLQLNGIYVGRSDGDAAYQFGAAPRKALGFINSACWRGYVAHFELDSIGCLILRKYVALDRVEQPVDEILKGDFWLEMEGALISQILAEFELASLAEKLLKT